MPKICVDATVLQHPLTGVGRALLGLYEACLDADPTLEALFVHRGPLSCRLPANVASANPLPWVGERLWRRAVLKPWLGLRRPDVVHFPWNGDVVRPWGGALTVLTLHDLIPLALPSLYFASPELELRFRRQVERSLSRAALVVTDSECSKRDITSRFATRREPVVVYLANALPSGVEGNPVGSPGAGGYYLYFGGYDVRKGLDLLLPVYRRLFAGGEVTVPLVLVGSPHRFSRAFAREVSEAIASGAVIEMGYVADAELVRWVRGARALVYPSRYEGFGFPPLEAMALGCPVITTSVSSLPEESGDAADYVPVDDEDALARAILAVDRDEHLRSTLGQEGRARAAGFSWARSARTFLRAVGEAREARR